METARLPTSPPSSAVPDQPGPLLPAALLEALLERTLANGGEFAEAFVEERLSHAMSSDDGKVERITSGVQRGLGLRLVADGVTFYAYSEDLEPEVLLRMPKQLRTAMRAGGQPQPVKLALASGRAAEPEVPPERVSKSERVALLAEADATARAVDPRIVQVTSFLGTIVQTIQVANSEGVHAWDRRHRLRVRVQTVARHAGTHQLAVGTYAPGVSTGFEFLSKQPITAIAERAARQALVQLEAVPAPAGRMPVVLGNGVGGVIVHEACGHGLEGDMIQRRASVYMDLLGQQVAVPQVTIVDNATVAGAWGSYSVDDEGAYARCTVLVEGGVLRSFLHDRQTARALSCATTGNGRRASFRHLPLPRMTNTYIQPGDLAPEEIIAATPYGLFARSLSGGSVNPVNGNFQFTVREAYLIRDGKLAEPVRGATLVGNALAALRDIDLLGNDLDFGAGNCGKDGQKAMVGIGQPTLRIRELLVGGSQGGKERASGDQWELS